MSLGSFQKENLVKSLGVWVACLQKVWNLWEPVPVPPTPPLAACLSSTRAVFVPCPLLGPVNRCSELSILKLGKTLTYSRALRCSGAPCTVTLTRIRDPDMASPCPMGSVLTSGPVRAAEGIQALLVGKLRQQLKNLLKEAC